MADFCQQCSEEIFGEDHAELAHLVELDDICSVICEGCGPACVVDREGKCVSRDCLKKHGPISLRPSESCSKE